MNLDQGNDLLMLFANMGKGSSFPPITHPKPTVFSVARKKAKADVHGKRMTEVLIGVSKKKCCLHKFHLSSS